MDGEIVHVITDLPEVTYAQSRDVVVPREIAPPSGRMREFFYPLSPTSFLPSEEECLLRTPLHWWVPLKAILQGFVSMPLMFLMMFLLGWLFPGVWFLQVILWLSTVSHVCYIAYCVLDWRVDQVIVTDRRLMRTSGVFTDTVAIVELDKVTDTMFYRPFMGRIFDFGTIRVVTAGEGVTLEEIEFVPAPAAVLRVVLA